MVAALPNTISHPWQSTDNGRIWSCWKYSTEQN